jgi:hypothetical protein
MRVSTAPAARALPLFILPAILGAAVYVSLMPPEPDASYYVGGIKLFPSPIGTLLGTVGGYSGLAVLNAVAAFAILTLVGLVARELGNHALVAQGLVLLLVGGRWFQNSAMDAPGAALLLGAALLELRGRSRLALLTAGTAVGVHLATLPLVLGAVLVRSWRRRSTWITVFILAAAGAAIAALTSYRAGFHVIGDVSAVLEGGHEFVLACWPLLLLAPVATLDPRTRSLAWGASAGAVVAGAIPASVGQLGLTRYAAPWLFLVVPGLAWRSASLLRWRRGRVSAPVVIARPRRGPALHLPQKPGQ